MKPTKVMQDLLRYMAHGYNLMYSRHHTWLSDPYGGKTQNVRPSTLRALRKHGLIFTEDHVPEAVVPKISQETLAEMVGTTRSRVRYQRAIRQAGANTPGMNNAAHARLEFLADDIEKVRQAGVAGRFLHADAADMRVA